MDSWSVFLSLLSGYLLFKFLRQRATIKANQVLIEEYQSIKDLESRVTRLRREEETQEKKLAEKAKEIQHAEHTLEQLQKAYESAHTIMTVGLYAPHYDFGSSSLYKLKLEEIREQQKKMVSNGTAAVCTSPITFNGDAKLGQKITDNILKLMLRAFNGECDALIAKVKYNTVQAFEERIKKSATAINKLTTQWGCEIKQQYVQLKLKELYLVHEYQEKLEQEREEQRQIKEQMREEERAQKELEKAKQEAEKEEKRYQEALLKARKELEQARDEDREKFNDYIRSLEQQLAEAHQRKERAISQAQLTKSGHVYVISNIGSFGEGVYKIGMTRRLEPLDRIKELGDASVPFEFDVHAMMYSDDAPALEAQLHALFHHARVNRINERKEFFRVSLSDIEHAARHAGITVEFTRIAEAREYRESLLLSQEQEQPESESMPKLRDVIKSRNKQSATAEAAV